MSSVYALEDPRTNEIHYVGMAQDVHKRYDQHVNHPQNNKKKNAWIEELKEAGMVPTLIILEETDAEHVHDRELYWIQHYLDLGMPLVNVVDIKPQIQEPPIGRSVSYRLLVKEVAKQKGISMYRLHFSSEIALSSIKRLYRDPYADVRLGTLARLAEALCVPIASLFEEVQEVKH